MQQQQAPTPAGDDQKAKGLDTIVVTGSNIRRVDVETANPVVTIDRAKVQQAEHAPQKDDNAKRETKPGYSADVVHNSHLYPESWVAAIQRLIRAGKADDARQNIALFREKYPNYHLPADVERFAPQK